jgi:hypothetical protein
VDTKASYGGPTRTDQGCHGPAARTLGIGLGVGRPGVCRGVVGVWHAELAVAVAEQAVLPVRPRAVVGSRLVCAGAAGGADLLPARPRLRGLVEHRGVPVVAGKHLADRHVLQALRRGQRLRLGEHLVPEVVLRVELSPLLQDRRGAGAEVALAQFGEPRDGTA